MPMKEREEIHGPNLSALVKALTSTFNLTLRVYTVEKLAGLLGVSERTIRRYREDGYLSYTKVGDKYFFSDDDVREFLMNNHFESFRKQQGHR